MLPLRDNIPSSTVPVVNFTMIACCAFTFLMQLTAESHGVSLIERYGMIPARIFHPDAEIMVPDRVVVQTRFGPQYAEIERRAEPSAVSPLLTLVTCIFLHGGWLHFLGNMWFLYIFGDNVEDRLGHLGYLIFYVAAGVAASATHLFTNVDSTAPTIGASGAIAGVMGAYFCMYPRAMVLSVIPIFVFIQTVVLPAPVFLGIWFVMQFFSGLSSEASGVAWWAHIGGFVAGMAVAKVLDVTHHLRPPTVAQRPKENHIGVYRGAPSIWDN